jgi:DHA3 family tetracycline resistance protein-like MFS transporter
MKTNQENKDSTFYKRMIFVKSLLFNMIYIVTSLYEAKVAGLSGAQLVMVGTTLEISIFLFEIPTGIVADVFSRRLSIIIGFLIIGLGFIIEGLFPFFAAILFAQVFKGLGFTFTSGAEEAWLSDEIGEKNANRTFLQANKFDLAGSVLGMGIAIPLGNYSIQAPFLIGGPLFIVVGFCLILIMPEKGFSPLSTIERHSWHRFFDIFRKGFEVVKRRSDLRTALSAGFIYGLYSEGWDRLWVKHLITRFSIRGLLGISEITFLGLLRGVGVLLSIIGSYFVEKKLDSAHIPSITKGLMVFSGILSLSILLFAFSPYLLLCIIAVWLVSLARNLIGPLYSAWVNQRLDSESRATVISMSGQVDAIGQISSGPIAAAISLWSVQAAISAAAILLWPVFPLIKKAGNPSVSKND